MSENLDIFDTQLDRNTLLGLSKRLDIQERASKKLFAKTDEIEDKLSRLINRLKDRFESEAMVEDASVALSRRLLHRLDKAKNLNQYITSQLDKISWNEPCDPFLIKLEEHISLLESWGEELKSLQELLTKEGYK